MSHYCHGVSVFCCHDVCHIIVMVCLSSVVMMCVTLLSWCVSHYCHGVCHIIVMVCLSSVVMMCVTLLSWCVCHLLSCVSHYCHGVSIICCHVCHIIVMVCLSSVVMMCVTLLSWCVCHLLTLCVPHPLLCLLHMLSWFVSMCLGVCYINFQDVCHAHCHVYYVYIQGSAPD